MEKSISELLIQMVGSLKVKEADQYSTFFRSWKKIAGTELGAHSIVKEVEGSTVVVAVDHPGWKQMLQIRQNGILKALQRMFPELSISRMKIIVDSSLKQSLQNESATTSEGKKVLSRLKEKNDNSPPDVTKKQTSGYSGLRTAEDKYKRPVSSDDPVQKALFQKALSNLAAHITPDNDS